MSLLLCSHYADVETEGQRGGVTYPQGDSRRAKVTTQVCATPKLLPFSRAPSSKCPVCSCRVYPCCQEQEGFLRAAAGLGACHIFSGAGHEGGRPSLPPAP